MELILLQSVEGLGRPGDQVKVKSGYARNFLLPHGKAVALSANALRGIGKLKARADEEERQMVTTMDELGRKLLGTVVKINARATEEGHLFGSVTDKDVMAALAAAGWQLPARAVRMPSHIKDAGPTDVTLHLHGAITAEIKVDVVPIDGEGNVIDISAARAAAHAASTEADAQTDHDVPEEATNS
ncbi:MAG TPA: 50S ribosomal protein L9 [Planctomycetota bacterium]|nr:50S ribosomal protein L9 [Planctomycetota bacterium]